MDQQYPKNCTAFIGMNYLASGDVREVARRVKEATDKSKENSILIFDDSNGETVEIDLRGKVGDVLKRLDAIIAKFEKNLLAENEEPAGPKGPGRPKLGVISREVTLLPRHWDWLNNQPGGASVALRKLVEEARHANADKDKIRHSQDAAYKFMSAMAGNLPGYEEAIRTLFAANQSGFKKAIASWPQDIKAYAIKLAYDALKEQK
jgi:uncharacterized protein